MKIHLQDYKIFKWYKKDNIYVIGYIIKENEILRNDDLIECFKSVNNKKEILNILKEIDGRFTIIIEQEEEVIIISDILRSFPVFYKIEKKELIISNKVDFFKNKVLEKSCIKEFLSAGYITGKDTIYNEIYQTEASKILIINKNTYENIEEKYFVFKEEKTIKDSYESTFKELDKKYNNAIKRLIKYAAGRKIVIPLSRRT